MATKISTSWPRQVASKIRHWIIYRLFYPTLVWNLLLRWLSPHRKWWNRIDDHVILGALPFASRVPRLHNEGVRAVINTCREYGGPQKAYTAAGIEQFRLPTLDYTPPTLEDIIKGVEFIGDHAARNETIYVHCKAGRARSATIVLCWLIASQGMTPEQAQMWLISCRSHVNPTLYKRKVVEEFYRLYKDKPRSADSLAG